LPSEAKCDKPLARLQSYIDPMDWKHRGPEVARRDVFSDDGNEFGRDRQT